LENWDFFRIIRNFSLSIIYNSSLKKKKTIKKKTKDLTPTEAVRKELPKRTKNPLSAFASFPKRVSFETQEEKEKIILLLRKHWITNISWILLVVLMVFSPLFLSIFPLISLLPGRFQAMAVLIWYLITLAVFLEKFLSWYFNVYIITDERIIDVDFYSLVYKRISETKIDRIQDVSYSQGGLFQALFNFGNITIQTAAEVPEFEFDQVPQPAKVVRVLNNLVLEEEQEKIDGRVR